MSATDDEKMFFDIQVKTDKQHILDNPDTYIGSVENVEDNMWIMDSETDKIVEKNIHYNPGLFKLFDEGIVNCRDHVVRMQKMVDNNVPNSLPVTYIDVAIQEDGTIVMINDGNGMDVVLHPEYKLWAPELTFAHLRASTNFNKDEEKIVGGKNGYGFKLALIWSTYGCIETVDHIRGLKYVQEFRDNLDVICPPKITKATKAKPYTKITFKPDYQRLGISGLSEDVLALFKRRVYDISAVTDKNIKVKHNSSLVSIKNFEQYINLYIGDKTVAPRVHEESDPRWEYAVALSPTKEFMQVSFVNGIFTSKGGKHVEYILNQITKKLAELIAKKKKIEVNVNSIKEQIILFLRCDIVNPSFDSQSKDFLKTPMAKFGSKCTVSDKFIEKISKMGIMEQACAITQVKEQKVAKKTDGSKTKKLIGIPKLDDANWAGTSRSWECTLIITEGDSAKTAVISGLSPADRDRIGVYPARGKFLNVRGETLKKILESAEISDIKKILGLETGKEYETIEDVYKHLRYGRLVCLTDQDLDGTHIKGLTVNLFHTQWRSLTRIPGFICYMNTPILKATKGDNVLIFYNDGEYEHWKNNNNTKGWNIKYYKGLGTSSKTEFQQYLKEKKYIGFQHTGEACDNSVDLVFNKKRADDRKMWLETVYDRKSYIDTSKAIIPYEEFINKEFIHFSKYDCDRNIPNLMDGLKTSLRKILWAVLKRSLTQEIKVARLSGFVSESAGYHHGEESLNKAIIGMAQNFIGSNNINLLFPSGQFGSRLEGGKDSASPRYVYTRLEKITRCIFPKQDDAILTYLEDDGTPVEPQFYVPIIPMVLVNGSKGVGTGFSTEIMCYNPKDIITYLKNKLQGETNDSIEFMPYYEGFTGTIEKLSETQFLFKGTYEKIDEDTIKVTELPVGHWTSNFKELLDELMSGKDKKGNKVEPIIDDVQDNKTDTTVEFTITFVKGKLAQLEASKGDHGCNGLEKLLKLYNTNSITNMHLFNYNDKLKKYDSVQEIIDDYFEIRLEYYDDRKENMMEVVEKQINVLANKVKFIHEILEGTIDLRKKKKQEINDMLIEKDYYMDEDAKEPFDYLLSMPLHTMSDENVEHLKQMHQNKIDELERIRNTTVQQMWMSELEELEIEYQKYREERALAQLDLADRDADEDGNKKAKKKSGAKKVVKKMPKLDEENVVKKAGNKKAGAKNAVVLEECDDSESVVEEIVIETKKIKKGKKA